MAALLKSLATVGMDLAVKGLATRMAPTNHAVEALALQQSLHQRKARMVYAGVPMVANVVTTIIQSRAQRHMMKKLLASHAHSSLAVQASAAAMIKGASVLKVALIVGGVTTVCVAALAVGWWVWQRRRQSRHKAVVTDNGVKN